MKAPKAPKPAAQRRLREVAGVLSRAVEAPPHGTVVVPTNRWWMRGVVDALLKLADGMSVNRAFASPKKTGRPRAYGTTGRGAVAYYRYMSRYGREDMPPGEHEEMLRKALRAANKVSPKLTRATIERYFRRWRQHVLGTLEFDGFEPGAVDTDTAKLERMLAKRTRGRRQ